MFKNFPNKKKLSYKQYNFVMFKGHVTCLCIFGYVIALCLPWVGEALKFLLHTPFNKWKVMSVCVCVRVR